MKKILMLVGLSFVFTLYSCEDNEDAIVNPETELEETAFAENVFTEIAFDIDEAIDIEGMDNGRFGRGFQDCATRDLEEPEDGGFPKVVTVDFGDGCENGKGMIRSGKMILTITGPRGEVGSQVIQTFENLYVNDYLIEGTRTRTIESETVRTTVLEGGKITTPEGEVISRTASRRFEMVAGYGTVDRSDDMFEITGSASGITPAGANYTKEITTPLVRSFGCPWITAGVIETTLDGASRSLDFGDGECDNVATLTTEEGTEEITMDFRIKRRFKHRKG